MEQTHIVKRKGHLEKFDEKKAYASVYFACRSSHLGEQEAEKIAQKVLQSLTKEMAPQKEVSSDWIFSFISKEMEKHNKDAAYMYRTHRDIS